MKGWKASLDDGDIEGNEVDIMLNNGAHACGIAMFNDPAQCKKAENGMAAWDNLFGAFGRHSHED